MIYKIIKLELKTLFFTPIAWLVLIIFTALLGIRYTDILDGLFDLIKMNNKPGSITIRLFEVGLYKNIADLLFLFIPVLTMGLISREKSSGTIKLLYSSPLRMRTIILGKYFGLLIYSLLFLVVITIIIFNTRPFVANFDMGTALSGLIAIFLLIVAYTAIGLFMSTLTNYQVISALAAMVFIKGLSLLNGYASSVSIVGDIVNWLAVTDHSVRAISGLLKSADIVYFIVFAIMFLFFSVFKLQSEGQTKSEKRKTWLKSVMVLLIAIGITSFFAAPSRTTCWDLTNSKKHSLNPYSQKVCDSLDRSEPLTITTYGNIIANYQVRFGKQQKDQMKFNLYHKHIPKIHLKYVPYYDKKVKTKSHIQKLDAFEEIEKASRFAQYDKRRIDDVLDIEDIDCKDEIRALGGHVRKFEYKGKTEFLCARMLPNSPEAIEREVVTLLKRFLVPSLNVVFLDGHQERKTHTDHNTIVNDGSFLTGPTPNDLPKDWTAISSSFIYRYSLRNSGFNVSAIDFNMEDIPSETDVLVIGDPKVMYPSEKIEKLKNYIDGGGNLIIAGEPGSHAILNPILEYIGVEFLPGVAVKETEYIGKTAKDPSVFLSKCSTEDKELTGTNVKYMDFNGAGGLRISDTNKFEIAPVFSTTDEYWLDREGPDKNYLVKYDSKKGEKKGIVNVVLSLNRSIHNKRQKIIVAADADFLSNQKIIARGSNLSSQLNFCYDIFNWFANGEYPIRLVQPNFSKEKLEMTNEIIARLRTIFIWLVPGIFALLGFIILFIRRRM
ncbi:Gldg family protein [Marinifilum sp.]|uniref:Gldg family protein n=1 Tax=Marinifilum sp. TaxID=2033137 RepID=UPI003BAA24A2